MLTLYFNTSFDTYKKNYNLLNSLKKKIINLMFKFNINNVTNNNINKSLLDYNKLIINETNNDNIEKIQYLIYHMVIVVS